MFGEVNLHRTKISCTFGWWIFHAFLERQPEMQVGHLPQHVPWKVATNSFRETSGSAANVLGQLCLLGFIIATRWCWPIRIRNLRSNQSTWSTLPVVSSSPFSPLLLLLLCSLLCCLLGWITFFCPLDKITVPHDHVYVAIQVASRHHVLQRAATFAREYNDIDQMFQFLIRWMTVPNSFGSSDVTSVATRVLGDQDVSSNEFDAFFRVHDGWVTDLLQNGVLPLCCTFQGFSELFSQLFGLLSIFGEACWLNLAEDFSFVEYCTFLIPCGWQPVIVSIRLNLFRLSIWLLMHTTGLRWATCLLMPFYIICIFRSPYLVINISDTDKHCSISKPYPLLLFQGLCLSKDHVVENGWKDRLPIKLKNFLDYLSLWGRVFLIVLAYQQHRSDEYLLELSRRSEE